MLIAGAIQRGASTIQPIVFFGPKELWPSAERGASEASAEASESAQQATESFALYQSDHIMSQRCSVGHESVVLYASPHNPGASDIARMLARSIERLQACDTWIETDSSTESKSSLSAFR